MKVELISYTQNALNLLLYTKNTRLSRAGLTLKDIEKWSDEKKMKELDYMRKTIQSSWEFVDYTFEITGVTRAFTHQLVRTRKGSYAQQSQRCVNMKDFDFVTTGFLKVEKGMPKHEAHKRYCKTMETISESYNHLIRDGVPPQDARGILPTNICTNIIAKFDLRCLADMAKRLCTRTQGEYQEVFKEMKKEILKVHPWADKSL